MLHPTLDLHNIESENISLSFIGCLDDNKIKKNCFASLFSFLTAVKSKRPHYNYFKPITNGLSYLLGMASVFDSSEEDNKLNLNHLKHFSLDLDDSSSL